MRKDAVSLRSPWSARFEIRIRSLALPALLLSRSKLDLAGRLQEFAAQIAIVEPSLDGKSLPIVYAGAALLDHFESSLKGSDYLDIVEPNVRAGAMESANMMVHHKCGLWQISPLNTSDGSSGAFEFTGFPVIEDNSGPSQLAFFVHRLPIYDIRSPRTVTIAAASHWQWLDLGHGAPGDDSVAPASNVVSVSRR